MIPHNRKADKNCIRCSGTGINCFDSKRCACTHNCWVCSDTGVAEGIECVYCPTSRYQEEMTKEDLNVENHKEQVEPTPNNHPFIKDLVLKDIAYRAELGKSRYKTYLQPHNGRSALQDGYEEVLDLAQYLRQRIFEETGK